jgi:hypothetical protein
MAEETVIIKERRWCNPSKRAKKYAEDRKAGVHTKGPKMGQPLTDYQAGMRSGYMQSQSDHAAMYKFKKALDEGKTKDQAFAEAKTIVRKKAVAPEVVTVKETAKAVPAVVAKTI